MGSGDVRVVAVVVVALILVAILALVLRGRMTGDARLPGMRLRLSTRRDPPRKSGTAVIEDSTSRKGGATAVAPGKARISRTKVEGDLAARVEERRDLKG